MPRFFSGDELGTVKSIRFSQSEGSKEWKSEVTTVVPGISDNPDKARAIQKLAVEQNENETLLTAARADGSATFYRVGSETAEVVHEWKEPRLKSGQHYVGLAMSGGKIYTCTSNGALRLTQVLQNEALSTSSASTSVLPTRLCDWKLSHDGSTFAYGGDEVELSVWSTETAFSKPLDATPANADQKKRKRREQLLPGEVWRAKNVANDNLDLRVPVHNTALMYLHPSPSACYHHLLTGTQLGNVRRYDTRAARRPIADWKGIGKIGGIKNVQKGYTENEIFVSDHGCNLFAADLRNGKVIYGYQGLSGAITSMTTSGSLLASVSQDRFVRLHSTFPPPPEAGHRQEQKGEILEKVYLKVIPTVVASDDVADVDTSLLDAVEDEAVDDDVWNAMENAEESDEEIKSRSKSKKARAAR
ncbi:hypothetical protein OBBRIDRAFT_809688 [Obba rivulosa]|uniref:Ribosome biogenesis protein NSA1 n=1 Tax=Obba rivulosa TaxID=1052685 RepID=A0A8E2DTR1_9APHY|nr:hypothetical protein OBBRIDRAFT_809688 [Obba rivulosa]